MMELTPGCHYFLAVKRGSCEAEELYRARAAWMAAGIDVQIVIFYDNPSECSNIQKDKSKVMETN